MLRHLLDLSLEAAARAIGREILVATEATPPGCSARDWVREIARRFLGGEAVLCMILSDPSASWP